MIGTRLAALEDAIAALGAAPPDPALVAAIAALGGEIDAVAAAVAAITPPRAPDPGETRRLAAVEPPRGADRRRFRASPAGGGAGASPRHAAGGRRGPRPQPTALAGLPAALAALDERIGEIASQQEALAAASAGIPSPELAAVADTLRAELAALAGEVARLGGMAAETAPEVRARLAAIEAARPRYRRPPTRWRPFRRRSQPLRPTSRTSGRR